MDWSRLWDNFRSGIGLGFLFAIGLVVILMIYYLTLGSRKSRRIEVAKWRARKLLENHEIPDDKTYNYIIYMLSPLINDLEATEIVKNLQLLKKENQTSRNL